MIRKKKSRRILAFFLAVAMTICNISIGGIETFAAEGLTIDFVMTVEDFQSAVKQVITPDSTPVTEADFDFASGDIQYFDNLFFHTESGMAWYECDPQFDIGYEEAQIRTFVQLPESLADGYSLTGKEKVVFLYINQWEEEITCSVTLLSDNGAISTKPVKVKPFVDMLVETETPVVSTGSNAMKGQERLINLTQATSSVAEKATEKELVEIGTGHTGKADITSLNKLGLFSQLGKEFDIADLMDDDYPQVTILGVDGTPIPTMVVDGVIWAKSEENAEEPVPLPSDAKIGIKLSYSLENSSQQDEREHIVGKGDVFSYLLPDNLKFPSLFDVKNSSGEQVIGTAQIDQGDLNISITENSVGSNFKGTVSVRGSVDWEQVEEGNTEIVFTVGEQEYRLKFDQPEMDSDYQLEVKKVFNGTENDVTYDPVTGLETGVRFTVSLKAGENNTGNLTEIRIDDQLSRLFKKPGAAIHEDGYLTFDVGKGIILEKNTIPDTVVADALKDVHSVHFGERVMGSDTIAINLLNSDGNPAELVPGQEIVFSYWLKMDPEIWNISAGVNNKTPGSITSYSQVQFSNTIHVTPKEMTKKSSLYFYNQGHNWFTKSGTVIPAEEGSGTPAQIQYNVFVNPQVQEKNLVDLTGWTVIDTLDEGQSYIGEVEVKAYENSMFSGDPIWTETFDTFLKTDGNKEQWAYTFKDPNAGKHYVVFTYRTTPNEMAESNLSNEVLILPPGSDGGGFGQGVLAVPYSTYSLSKTNVISDMKSDNIKEPNKNREDNTPISWNKGFGTIRWESVLQSYLSGKEGGSIPKNARYTDSLTVQPRISNVTWGEYEKYQVYHTFRDLDTLKKTLSLKDGSNKIVELSSYDVALTEDRRTFTITFRDAVKAPVTISYNSFVSSFEEFGSLEICFVNEAKLNIGEANWVKQAAQPYCADDVLMKDGKYTENGEIVWNLIFNKGYGDKYYTDFSDVGSALIVEEIPQGLSLKDIQYKDQSLDSEVEYSVHGSTVTIDLKKLAETKNLDLSKKQNLKIITKITDLEKKSFTNYAQMIIDSLPIRKASAQVQVGERFLTKGMQYDEHTAPSAVYTLEINRDGADISNLPDGTLTVRDQLKSGHMSYVVDSFRIINSLTKEDIKYAVLRITADSFTIENLPDETPVEITYRVNIGGSVGSQVDTVNQAELIYGNGKSVISTVDRPVHIVEAAAVGSGSCYLRLYKVDQNGIALNGAEFTLYSAREEGGRWVKDHQLGTYIPQIISGAQGEQAVIRIPGSQENLVLKPGMVYYLEETRAPDGYAGMAGRFFAFEGGQIPDWSDVPVIPSGSDLIIENSRQSGSLSIHKTVTGIDKLGIFEKEFYFVIYDGTYYYDIEGNAFNQLRTVTVPYSSTGVQNNTVTIPGLPAGNYTVREAADSSGSEIDENNFHYSVSVNGRNGGTANVTVAYEQTTTLEYVNNYHAAGELMLVGNKALTGRELSEREFGFTIYENGKVVSAAQNLSNGEIHFSPISYQTSDIGLHRYIIRENAGYADGVTYDKEEYSVSVLVSDGGNGIVTAQVSEIRKADGTLVTQIQFRNIYAENEETGGGETGGGDTGGGETGGGDTGGGDTGGGDTGGGDTGGGETGGEDTGGTGSDSNSPTGTTVITPEEVPLAQLPQQLGEDGLITIDDGEIPLAALPKTGENAGKSILLLMTSMITGLYLSIQKKKREK